MRRSSVVLSGLWVAGLVGCTEPKPPLKAPPPPSARVLKTAKTFAAVPRGTTGPYLAVRNDGALALWAYGQDEVGWLSRSLNLRGAPKGPVRRVAESLSSPELVRLVPFRGGYLAAWSGKSAEGPTLSTLHFLEDGRLAGPAQSLPAPSAPPFWLEVVETAEGGLVFWAEHASVWRDGEHFVGAALFVRAVDAGGAPVSDVRAFMGPNLAWQAVAAERGAVLALVGYNRKLSLVQLSPEAQVVATHEVPGVDRVNAEVDLARVDDRLLYAFTANAPLEPRVFVGVAEPNGAPLSPPRPAVPALGEQRLVRLVGGEQRAHLVWQDVAQAREWFKVTSLGGDGAGTGEVLQVPWDGTTAEPEFQPLGDELRALVWACVESVDCANPKLPVQLDFAPDLTPKRVNPWLADERVPDMAWNLACHDEGCLGLAAVFGDTTDVFAVGAKTAEGQFALPAYLTPRELPRAAELRAELDTLPLSGFDALREAGGTLVSWLSYFDPAEPYVIPKTPAPDGRLAPVRAQLWTQWVPDAYREGATDELPAANVVSYRAHSPGGVALSSGSKGLLLVWSAIDGKTPQVFTTLLDPHGKKVAQQMLTRQKGDIQQVSATPSEDGWFVGWIDDRGGRQRAALTRLGPKLERKLPDQLLGDAETTATGHALLRVGSELWQLTANAWSERFSRIELNRLDARGLKLQSHTLLTDGETNDHSPSLGLLGNQVVVAFIREDANGSLLHLLRLDAQGAPNGEVTAVETHHDVVGFALDCEAVRCRLLMTTNGEETQYLEAASLNATESGRARVVGRISSPSSLSVAPLLRANEGWVYDQASPPGGARLYRAALEF